MAVEQAALDVPGVGGGGRAGSSRLCNADVTVGAVIGEARGSITSAEASGVAMSVISRGIVEWVAACNEAIGLVIAVGCRDTIECLDGAIAVFARVGLKLWLLFSLMMCHEKIGLFDSVVQFPELFLG